MASGLSVHTLSRPRFVFFTIRARPQSAMCFETHLLRECKRLSQSVNGRRTLREPLDHCRPSRVRQCHKCSSQNIHNHMVVDFASIVNGDAAFVKEKEEKSDYR